MRGYHSAMQTQHLAPDGPLIAKLHSALPNLLAIHAFGSQVQGTAGADSDLDLAVLVAGMVDPLLLWRLSGELAELVGCGVDLLDLRAASTVMQYQVITTGQRLWAQQPAAGGRHLRVFCAEREDRAGRSPRRAA